MGAWSRLNQDLFLSAQTGRVCCCCNEEDRHQAPRTLNLHCMQRTGIVIPCYNEFDRLDAKQFADFITTYPQYYCCFVNDGSSDQTAVLLEEIVSGNTSRAALVNLVQNSGKAEAVRQGILHCLQRDDLSYVGFIDADLATPLSQVHYLVGYFDAHQKQMVFGSRVKRLGITMSRKTHRHLFGRLFATITSNILGLPIYDSQCGSKFMTPEYARTAFADVFISKWAFDVEIFARLKKGYRDVEHQVLEIPLFEWQEIAGSKLNMWSMVGVLGDLYRIRRHYKLK